jgi:hypothetical protein
VQKKPKPVPDLERHHPPVPYEQTRVGTRQDVEDGEDMPEGIKPRDADPDYGPPDPDDPQRSGT